MIILQVKSSNFESSRRKINFIQAIPNSAFEVIFVSIVFILIIYFKDTSRKRFTIIIIVRSFIYKIITNFYKIWADIICA